MKDERNTKRQFKNELVTSEGERKRVERRALRQRTLLEAINKVFRETLRCETDEEVASTCLAVAQELTGSQFGFIGEVNQAGLFDTIALSDPGWHACRMPRSDAVRMIKDMKIRGIWGTVLKDEQSLIVNHPDSHPNRVGTPQGHPSITSFLGVLLKYGGKTFGMIGLANKESGYDLADQQTVETLSVAFMEALMRKRMEEALKESEEKFRTLFENSRDAIFIADTVTGKIMDVNQAACDLTGMSKADLIGLHQSELHPPDKTDEYRRLFKEHVSSGKAITTDLYVRRADGELVPVDISASMVKMGDRVVIQGVFRNVTERKHMEEALRESEEKYRRIFETSKDVLYLTSREGKFIDINQAGVDLFGYSKKELLRMDLAKDLYVNPDDRKRFQEMIEKHGFVKDYEVQFKKKDGTKIYVSITANVRKDSSGNIEGYEGIIRDITYQKQAEEEIKRHAREIEKISKAAHIVSSSLEIEEVLPRIIRLAGEVTGADFTSVVLMDEEGHATSSIEDFYGIPPLHVRARPQGMTQRILTTGKPLVIDDQKMTEGIKLNPPLVKVGIRSCAGVPLVSKGKTLGILFVHSRIHTFRNKMKLLETFAKDAAIALENARLYEEVKRLYKETKESADKDPLTGLFNHGRINELLENEIERAKRGAGVFSIMMLDVDDLKLINDTYGHIVGDRLLKDVASLLKSTCRSIDLIGRYAGDEFLVILPYTDGQKAKTIAKRISRRITQKGLRIGKNITIPLRLSIGTATYPYDSMISRGLVSLADRGMYESKRSGRSVVSASMPEVTKFLTMKTPSLASLQGLVAAVNSKNHYTEEHSEMVTNYVISLGKKVRLSDEQMHALQIAGLLHDIGKIGIPGSILRKLGPLKREEFEIIKQHPGLGATMLDGLPHQKDVVGAIMYHHERYDGKGYPKKLKGKDIPLFARIIAVVDAYSAMITDRPYRKALTKDQAIEELKKGAGTQFDPDLVSKFIECLKEREA